MDTKVDCKQKITEQDDIVSCCYCGHPMDRDGEEHNRCHISSDGESLWCPYCCHNSDPTPCECENCKIECDECDYSLSQKDFEGGRGRIMWINGDVYNCDCCAPDELKAKAEAEWLEEDS